ncbi:alpha/beta fold hydrolase [Rhodoflexus sp.]
MSKIFRYLLFLIGGLLTFVVTLVVVFWKNDLPQEQLRKKYSQAPSAFIDVQGMEVHYRSEGEISDSLPIVLLHGTGASLHTWDGWTSALIPARRVVRMDLPAYGLTGPHPSGDYSIAAYVSFVNEFLDKLNIQRCVLGGNSLGGSIAWNYALQHPDRVAGLVLVDAGGYPASSTTRRESPVAFRLATMPVIKDLFRYVLPRSVIERSVTNVYGDPSLVTDELIDRYYELSLHPGNRRAFIDRMGARNKPTDTLLIKTLQMPTLVMWGDRDLLIPVECAYKFQRDLPNSTLAIFEGLGHMPMEENPALTVQAVQQFLRQIE